MQCVLAVDGGNTKTISIVAALDGTILGAGRGGCGDIYNARAGTDSSIVGAPGLPPQLAPALVADTLLDGSGPIPGSAAVAIANIEYAVMSALQAAQVNTSHILTGVFSMAGADWPEDFALLQAAMEARNFGRTIIVQNDALGVLHADSSDNTGVSVVCGTGAGTGARGPDGRIWHSSRWQDQAQGSSQLAHKTLDAIYRSELDIEPPTTLTQRVLDFFHLNTVEEVLHLFTSRMERPPINIGLLTPILLDEAHAGDSIARQIVEEHGSMLGNYALAAARHVGIEGTAFTLVLAGGVLRHHSPLLADAIIRRVQTTSPQVRPTRYRFEPIIGVLFTALEAANVAIDDALLAKLIPTMPASELFATGQVTL